MKKSNLYWKIHETAKFKKIKKFVPGDSLVFTVKDVKTQNYNFVYVKSDVSGKLVYHFNFLDANDRICWTSGKIMTKVLTKL